MAVSQQYRGQFLEDGDCNGAPGGSPAAPSSTPAADSDPRTILGWLRSSPQGDAPRNAEEAAQPAAERPDFFVATVSRNHRLLSVGEPSPTGISLLRAWSIRPEQAGHDVAVNHRAVLFGGSVAIHRGPRGRPACPCSATAPRATNRWTPRDRSPCRPGHHRSGRCDQAVDQETGHHPAQAGLGDRATASAAAWYVAVAA